MHIMVKNLYGGSVRAPRQEIHGVDSEGVGGPYLQERITKAFPTITTDHAFIHEGLAYSWTGVVTVNGSYSIGFKTSATGYTHFKPSHVTISGGPVTITLVEGPSVAGGSAATPRNRNRNKSDASTMTCLAGVTPAGGTIIFTSYLPATQGQGAPITGEANQAEEFVLKPGTQYVLTFEETNASTIQLAYDLFWYEESNA